MRTQDALLGVLLSTINAMREKVAAYLTLAAAIFAELAPGGAI